MTEFTLILRNLVYYRRSHLATAASLAVAAAVMCGSLLVGASIKQSMRRIVLGRLGQIDSILLSPTFFRQSLAEMIAVDPALSASIRRVEPAILTSGTVRAAGSGETYPQATVIGVRDGFWRFYPALAAPVLRQRDAAISPALASALNLSVDDFMLVRVSALGSVATRNLFAHKQSDRATRRLRLRVARILPRHSAGDFSLDGNPLPAANIFLDLDWLSGEGHLNRAGEANMLLVATTDAAITSGILTEAMRRHLSLADLGLFVESNPAAGYTALKSRALVIPQSTVQVAVEVARHARAATGRTSIYMANTLARVSDPDAALHYLTIAALEPLKPLPTTAGSAATLDENAIWINSWAAEDLGAELGESLRLSAFLPTGIDREQTRTFTLTGIVPIEGPAADPALVPDFEGLSASKHIEDWDPPFPFYKERITDRDEAYWDLHRATPKAYLHMSVLRALWQGDATIGEERWITSIRTTPPEGQSPGEWADAYRKLLVQSLPATGSASEFQSIRDRALGSVDRSMDFGVLFSSMSFLLVLSSIGLAGMTMRLSILRRSRHGGVMQAHGIPRTLIRRTLLMELLSVASVGVITGSAAAVLYAQGIVYALSRWWSGAIGRVDVSLTVGWEPLLAGSAITLAVGAVAIVWALRTLRGFSTLELVSGAGTMTPGRARKRRVTSRRVCLASLVFAGALIAGSVVIGIPAPQWAFMSAGVLLLVCLISATSIILERAARVHGGRFRMSTLAARSLAANPERSMLVIGLLACASFLIAATAANKQSFSRIDVTDRDSGTGGFALRAQSTIPLPAALDTPGGRRLLGFESKDEMLFQDVTISTLQRSGGDDVSCLNIAAPGAPRLLGVPDSFIERGGFTFAGVEGDDPNPWDVLRHGKPGNGIPFIGDAASVQWQLHSGLGRDLEIALPGGGNAALRCAGMLKQSIFQSELLVSVSQFHALFPAHDGRQLYLIDVPPEKMDALKRRLHDVLGEWGFRATPSPVVLNRFIDVQNTYLAMFLILGGLGLLLGTLGMLAVLMRNAMERRREFAVMQSMGFPARVLARLLGLENTGLLLAGIAGGTLAALIAFVPQARSARSDVNTVALFGVLIAVYLVGSVCVAAAARVAVSGPLLENLREE